MDMKKLWEEVKQERNFNTEEESKDIYSETICNQEAKNLIMEFLHEKGFDKEKIVPILKAVSTLIDNLINYPFEEKYWTLKTTNKAV